MNKNTDDEALVWKRILDFQEDEIHAFCLLDVLKFLETSENAGVYVREGNV